MLNTCKPQKFLQPIKLFKFFADFCISTNPENEIFFYVFQTKKIANINV